MVVPVGPRCVITIGLSSVEAWDGSGKLSQLDEVDVGAGVEGLVFRLVEVGNVLDLQRGVVAGGGGRREGQGDAGVAWVQLAEGGGVDESLKVIVRLGIFGILAQGVV